MKKIHIALAVLATATLTSCMEEKSFNNVKVGENDLAFVMQTGASTRATEFDSQVTEGIHVPIAKLENGRTLFLEETITDLNAFEPETRGVPIFTENVGKIYKDKLFVHADGFGDATFENVDNAIVGGGWRYTHNYGSNKWPEDGSAVDFFLRMPSDMTGVTFGNDAYASGAKTVFTYTSPTTAESQTDIIFAGITLDKATHDQNLPNGTPVTFYHALTAVKFAIANPSSEIESKSIQVTSIAFAGLKNTGTCTIDPSADVKVAWSNTSATVTPIEDSEDEETKPNEINQDFVVGDLVEFNPTNNPDFGQSFFNPGTETKPGTDKQNINSQNASKTFWLVPQDFTSTSSAILHIGYTVNGNDEYMDIALKDILAGVDWKPGQLRTYTFRLDEVNVQIDDKINVVDEFEESIQDGDDTFEALSYKGSTKTDVVIKNTGNTDAFIRAALVGQWLNDDGDPVFGFTDFGDQIQPLVGYVDSWYEDQFVTKEGASAPARTHGKFLNLAGYDKATLNNKWQLCDDGYYYYTEIVPKDAVVPNNLFTSYTVGTPPAVRIAASVKNVYFELQIATQAVSAKKLDGTDYTWKKAWERALGKEPVVK